PPLPYTTLFRSLDGHDAEIFFAGKQQCPAAPQMVTNDCIGLPAEKAHAWSGQRTQPRLILAGPNDDQRPAQAAACHNGEVEPLVRRERGYSQVVFLARDSRRTVKLGVHRRKDDLTGTAITLHNAPLHSLADGDEVSHPLRRSAVPIAQPGEQPSHRIRFQAAKAIPEI